MPVDWQRNFQNDIVTPQKHAADSTNKSATKSTIIKRKWNGERCLLLMCRLSYRTTLLKLPHVVLWRKLRMCLCSCRIMIRSTASADWQTDGGNTRKKWKLTTRATPKGYWYGSLGGMKCHKLRHQSGRELHKSGYKLENAVPVGSMSNCG